MSIEDDKKRYLAAAHAMQTGVAYDMEQNGDGGAGATPKHLRVGVNSGMVNAAAMAKLMIAKGLITEAELHKALADEMEAELARYQAKMPKGVTLA